MKLETGGSLHFNNVTEEQLRATFQDDRSRGEFIILSQQEEIYIQAGGEQDGPYCLEYRDGDDWHHFRATGEFTKADVEKAFLAYLAGADQWREDFSWEKI